MTLEDIITNKSKGRLKFKVTVDGKPVYDYKAGTFPFVNLIYDSPEGLEDENIDLTELIEFCKTLLQPFQTIEFADEFTNRKLNKFTWQNSSLDLTY